MKVEVIDVDARRPGVGLGDNKRKESVYDLRRGGDAAAGGRAIGALNGDRLFDNDTAYTFQNLGYNAESARFTEMIYELFPEKESAL